MRPRDRLLAAVLAALLALPLVGRPVGAAPPQMSKVFLVRIQAAADVSPLIPRRLTEQLRAELGTAETVDLLPDEEAATDIEVGARAVDLREDARKALEQGRDAFGRSEYAKAGEHLRKALKAFDESAAVLDDVKPVAYVHVLLGIAEGRRGNDQECVKAFSRALVLQPTVSPDLTAQPQKIRKAFERARKVLKAKNGGATITSQPEGVDVFVDGRPAGQTPAVLDLLPGSHYIRATRPGYAPAGTHVEIKSGESAQVPLRLRAQSAAAAAGGDAARAAFHGEIIKRLQSGAIDVRLKDVANRFSERLGAAYLIVGHVTRGPDGYLLRVYMYRRAGNKLVELDAAKFDSELVNLSAGLYTLAEQIHQATRRFPAQRDITTTQLNLDVPAQGGGRGTGGTIDTGPVAVTGETGPRIDISPPVWRTWWFWTLIGAVVVGASTAGLVLALQPKHDGLYGGPVTLR
ncbi:MAG: PEGA domain-containing protein [Deltaproteobacteria bacterium]|nr:PEGA domain-containing protein [Deltaproteobacteria bacterium]